MDSEDEIVRMDSEDETGGLVVIFRMEVGNCLKTVTHEVTISHLPCSLPGHQVAAAAHRF